MFTIDKDLQEPSRRDGDVKLLDSRFTLRARRHQYQIMIMIIIIIIIITIIIMITIIRNN